MINIIMLSNVIPDNKSQNIHKNSDRKGSEEKFKEV